MRLPGLYRGVVVNGADPMGRGRLQVQVAAIGGNTLMWAERSVPFGGSGTAAVGAGTQVWVAFEAGNIEFPVALGVKA